MKWRQYAQWLAEHRIVVLGFAVSTAYWPTMLSPSFTPQWAAMAIGLALFCSLDPRKITGLMQCVLGFLLALGAISLFATPDIYAGSRDLCFMVMLCFAFILGAEQETLDDVLNGLGAGLAVSAAITLFTMSNGSDQGRDNMFGAAPTGLFYNSEIYGELAGLVFVWAVVRQRIGIAAVALLPLMFCQSRVGIMAASIGLLYAYWPQRWSRRLMTVGGLATLAVALLFVMGLGKAMSADQRLDLWAQTFLSITTFGRGLGWFIAASEANEFAHSDALQMLAEIGVGGIVAILIPIAAFARNRGNNAERALFVAVCVEVVISYPLHFPAAGFLAAVVAGHLAGGRDLVRVGERVGGLHHGGDIRWRTATSAPGLSHGRRLDSPVSDRSVSADQAEIYPGEDREYPATARAIVRHGPAQTARRV